MTIYGFVALLHSFTVDPYLTRTLLHSFRFSTLRANTVRYGSSQRIRRWVSPGAPRTG